MILCIDTGNTNIKCGVFNDAGAIIKTWRLATDKAATADQYGLLFNQLLAQSNIKKQDITGAIVASVVPALNNTIQQTLTQILNFTPLFLGPGIKTGLSLRYDDPRQLGADRIASAVAAYNMHGGPVITADFGTATTFGAVNLRGEFLGGCICPGLALAAEALSDRTACLPSVVFDAPACVIAKNTVAGLQSGLVYGYIGQVEYLVARMRAELSAPECPVVATGGMARLIADRSQAITHVDPELTLKGLAFLYEKNRG
ncbi:MAG: type III pantothenate kinase [Clostridia bacterium]|nr:type III pantothenate kinase [Clostridia bacterium]